MATEPVRGTATDRGLLHVGGRGLDATVSPRQGAKIVSLTDANGDEWLLPPREPAAIGTPFTDAEMGGWDECAPTIVACTDPDGTELPDHGDLWNTVWWVNGSTMTAQGESLDYTIIRTIVPRENGLRFEYAVTARRRTPFLWASHPQFLAPQGSRVWFDSPHVVDALDAPGTAYPWPDALHTIDSLGPGKCRKLYAAPDAPVQKAALEVPGQGRLWLRWDSDTCPYLGVWFDQRAYAREPVIGLEPSTGYYDSLAHAVDNGRVLELERNEPVRWWVEVTVETTDSTLEPLVAETTGA